ncbi:MAG: NAD(P)H-dependent oxidoreductase [Ilumatobacteraceae bacterium]
MVTNLKLITSTTREGRSADHVLPWLTNRLERDERFDLEVLDLRDWKLPMFQETLATVGDRRNPTYSDPIVKAWNTKIAEGGAYVFVTAEYNHSIPGELKNAIDSVFASYAFRNKPASFVGYSGGPIAGARAVEHLAHIAIEAEMVPLRNTVLIAGVGQAFGEDDEPVNPATEAALRVMLDDLGWWSAVLDRARAEGELPPGLSRFMKELATLSS